jgi:hypothetical protein
VPTDTAKRQARSTKRQAQATKNQAKQTARTAANQAGDAVKPVAEQTEQTLRAAEKTVERAGRTLTTVLIDSAYAYVGLTDTAVAFLRALPNTVVKVRTEGPGLAETLQREFDTLSIRGRKVVDAIASNPATQRAVDQTRSARDQLKTAAGQVRKTAEVAEQAVEETASATSAAARTVGTQTDTSGGIEVEIETPGREVEVEATTK